METPIILPRSDGSYPGYDHQTETMPPVIGPVADAPLISAQADDGPGYTALVAELFARAGKRKVFGYDSKTGAGGVIEGGSAWPYRYDRGCVEGDKEWVVLHQVMSDTACEHCGAEAVLAWKKMRNGRFQIQARCEVCKVFLHWAEQTQAVKDTLGPPPEDSAGLL
jgi:hypothetical protein